jgi:hypothetical protein
MNDLKSKIESYLNTPWYRRSSSMGADNMSCNADAQRPEARPRDQAGSGTTMFSMAPMPSISTRITSPTLRNCGGLKAARSRAA